MAVTYGALAAEPVLSQLDKVFTREACRYTSCYCEENVYWLVRQLHSRGIPLASLNVVFISNASKQVPLWRQVSASAGGSSLVIWDYHVLVVEQNLTRTRTFIWDLDSTLPWPCSFYTYTLEALGHGLYDIPPQFARLYRVVQAEVFLQHFASDRSHMYTGNGQYQSPPPPYQCIVNAAGESNTLPGYLNMTDQHVVCSELQCQTKLTAGECEAECSQGQACSEGHGQAAQLLETIREPLGAVLTEQDFIAFFEGG